MLIESQSTNLKIPVEHHFEIFEMLCQLDSPPNIMDLSLCILNIKLQLLSSCWLSVHMWVDGWNLGWCEINVSGSIQMRLLWHTLSIWLRCDSQIDDRAGHWSRKWTVVSGSDLHSGQISNLLCPVVGEAAGGYCYLSRMAFAEAFLMSSLLLRSSQTGCIWSAVHASTLRCFRVDFWWTSFLSMSVHIPLMAFLTWCFHCSLVSGQLMILNADSSLYLWDAVHGTPSWMHLTPSWPTAWQLAHWYTLLEICVGQHLKCCRRRCIAGIAIEGDKCCMQHSTFLWYAPSIFSSSFPSTSASNPYSIVGST